MTETRMEWMDAQGTEAATLDTVRTLLDEALFGLRSIEDPLVAVREAHRSVSSALTHLYEAVGKKGNFAEAHGHLSRAVEATRSALEALQARKSDDAAVSADVLRVAQALSRMSQITFAFEAHAPVPPPEHAITRAILGEPEIRRIVRGAIPPAVPLPEREPREEVIEPLAAPPPVRTLEELEALLALAEASAAQMDAEDDDEAIDARDTIPPEAPPPPPLDLDALVFGRALTEPQWIRARAVHLLEDLAAMGRMRFPSPILPWLHADETERRLLTRIDALIACGEQVVPDLVCMLEDRPVPDPDLVWALVMFLGSLDGRDSIDQIGRLLRIVDLSDPEALEMVGDALSLAPHEGIDAMCRPWLSSSEPEKRALAVLVLSQRRKLALQEAIDGSQDVELAVVVEAVKAFARFPELLSGQIFHRLLHHRDPTVLRESLASAMRHRREAGLRRALELCHEGRAGEADAAMFVAIGAGTDEGRRALLEGAATDGGGAVLRAIGWFGDAELIEYLIGRLKSPDAVAAGLALERITGALLPPDGKLPDYAPDERPFARGWSEPIILPEPCVDQSAWGAWWKQHQRSVRPGTRYRWGHPWSPRDDLWEMEEPSTLIGERFWAWLEISVRTGGNLPLDAHRFATHQQRLLEQWKGWVARLGDRVGEGGWPTRYSA